MRRGLEELQAVERAAWHAACCRAVMQRRETQGVDDPFALWLYDRYGPPPGFDKLDRSVPIGIAARRRVFNRMVARAIGSLATNGQPFEVWLLGVGLDARGWTAGKEPNGALLTRASEIREFDLPGMIELRAQLIEEAALTRSASGPLAMSMDLSRAPSLPRTERPVLAIAEGLFDHLPEAARRTLLASLGAASPTVTLLFDSLSPKGAAFDNRRNERFTGDPGLKFVGAIADPVSFHADLGWSTRQTASLFQETWKIICERRPWLARLQDLPMPGFIDRLYTLHWLEHVP